LIQEAVQRLGNLGEAQHVQCCHDRQDLDQPLNDQLDDVIDADRRTTASPRNHFRQLIVEQRFLEQFVDDRRHKPRNDPTEDQNENRTCNLQGDSDTFGYRIIGDTEGSRDREHEIAGGEIIREGQNATCEGLHERRQAIHGTCSTLFKLQIGENHY
jgi:hypothetical protein